MPHDNVAMRALRLRTTVLIEALPIWVIPSGFFLLGAWDIAQWIGDRKRAHLYLAMSFALLGLLQWWRLSFLRRRVLVLQKHIEALELNRNLSQTEIDRNVSDRGISKVALRSIPYRRIFYQHPSPIPEPTSMKNNIEGKVIVITGASSGLGEATARHLSAEGAIVVLGARRADRIQALAAELTAKGNKAIAVTTDVTDRNQVKTLVDAAVQNFGRIDVMINNAGIMPRAPLERLTIDDWDRTIDINIKGVLYGIAAALPYMKDQKGGQFVNVSSVAGHKISPEGVVYAATKHAVRVISEGLRQEVKPYGIRTTIISPGAVATELLDSITQADLREDMNDWYAKTAIPADSFARCVAFAISQPDEVDINEILFRPTSQVG